MNALLELVAVPGTADWVGALLCLAGVFTAFLTTAVGLGGGLLLLAVMTLFLPVAAVIPLHGAIQLGANAVRTLMLLRRVRASLLLAFAAGGTLGALAGSQLLVELSEAWLQLLLGGSIVALAWLRFPPLRGASAAAVASAGAVTTAITLFAGATGPLVAAFLRALRLDRVAHVATLSACMTIQHALKVAVFVLAGFALGPYLPFLAAMLLCALAGTWLGRHVLLRLDDARFHRLLAVGLTLLALRLIYSGASQLLLEP